jgi:hypothetical protein
VKEIEWRPVYDLAVMDYPQMYCVESRPRASSANKIQGEGWYVEGWEFAKR